MLSQIRRSTRKFVESSGCWKYHADEDWPLALLWVVDAWLRETQSHNVIYVVATRKVAADELWKCSEFYLCYLWEYCEPCQCYPSTLSNSLAVQSALLMSNVSMVSMDYLIVAIKQPWPISNLSALPSWLHRTLRTTLNREGPSSESAIYGASYIGLHYAFHQLISTNNSVLLIAWQRNHELSAFLHVGCWKLQFCHTLVDKYHDMSWDFFNCVVLQTTKLTRQASMRSLTLSNIRRPHHVWLGRRATATVSWGCHYRYPVDAAADYHNKLVKLIFLMVVPKSIGRGRICIPNLIFTSDSSHFMFILYTRHMAGGLGSSWKLQIWKFRQTFTLLYIRQKFHIMKRWTRSVLFKNNWH